MAEMEELIFLKDFAARYHMGIKKARMTMKSMPHHESPLFVTVSACKAWEETELITPATPATKTFWEQEKRKRRAAAAKPAGKFLVPRERPEVV